MYLYHMTTSANQNLFHFHETEQPCAQAQHQNTKRNSILQASRLVYIAYEVRISCKGHLAPLCMFIVTSKTDFMFFKQHSWLFTG